MGMNVSSGKSGEPDVMVDINTTPLIDVMLVLLIMLIITIPIQTHAIKMNLPVGNPPPPAVQPEVVQIDSKLSQVAAEPVQAEIHLLPNKLVPYKDVAAVLAAAQRIGATKIGLIGNEQYMQ
jgi:biopolymer transport protein ExbD